MYIISTQMRIITLKDNGLDLSVKSPVYKIALYCLARFERDSRAWWIPQILTVQPWDEQRHREFRAMMTALGFGGFYRYYRGDCRPSPEELYAGRLLAVDLGLSGLSLYADIFGGRKDELTDMSLIAPEAALSLAS